MDNEFQKGFSNKKSESAQDEFISEMRRRIAKLNKEVSEQLEKMEDQPRYKKVSKRDADVVTQNRQALEEDIKCADLILRDKIHSYEVMREKLGADDVFFGDYYASKKEQILRDVRDYEEKIKNKIDMFEESLKEPKHMENSPNPKTPKTNKRGDFITMDHQLSRYDNEKSVLSRIGRRISHSFKRDLKSNKQDGVENAEDRAKHLE